MTEQADYLAIPEVTLGWRIQMALDHAGLKHGDLMDRFEVSRQTVSRWCRDAGVPPKKYILNEIAVMCGVNARWLIDGTASYADGPDDPGCPHQGSNLGPADYKSVIVPFSVRRMAAMPMRNPADEAA